MEIETLYCVQTFVIGIYYKGLLNLPRFKWCVVNRKLKISKQEVVDDKGSLAELCSCSNKVRGDSALIYICALFLLPFS